MSFTLFGLEFHWYGLIIGLAALLGLNIAEVYAKKIRLSGKCFWIPVLVALGLSLVGARAWHVMTDWHLYEDNLTATVAIWQGGLGVMGGMVFGLLGLWSASFLVRTWFGCRHNFWVYADLAALSLPFAQALGRFANYVNQELYGLPANLPWAIFIEPAARVTGFEDFAYFHPLFLYESIAMLVLGVFLWMIHSGRLGLGSKRASIFKKVGSSFYLKMYLVGYGLTRFGLEFLRLQSAPLPGGLADLGLSFNQTIAGLVAVLAGLWLLNDLGFWQKLRRLNAVKLWWFFALLVLSLVVVFVSLLTAKPTKLAESTVPTTSTESTTPTESRAWSELFDERDDGRLVELVFTREVIHGESYGEDGGGGEESWQQRLTVEIARSPAALSQGLSGREQLGSDGLLFILNQSSRPTFWMKDMRFDLDFVWLDQGRVVGLTTNISAPPPSTADYELELYHPPSPVDAVLELMAGDVERLGIGVGDKVNRLVAK